MNPTKTLMLPLVAALCPPLSAGRGMTPSVPVPPESASDSRPAPFHGSVHVAALAACRDALTAYTGDGRSFERLRDAVHALARVARAEELTPEQMLVEIKSMLMEAPALRAMPTTRAEASRARLVSAAIRAYYGDEG